MLIKVWTSMAVDWDDTTLAFTCFYSPNWIPQRFHCWWRQINQTEPPILVQLLFISFTKYFHLSFSKHLTFAMYSFSELALQLATRTQSGAWPTFGVPHPAFSLVLGLVGLWQRPPSRLTFSYPKPGSFPFSSLPLICSRIPTVAHRVCLPCTPLQSICLLNPIIYTRIRTHSNSPMHAILSHCLSQFHAHLLS